MWYKNLANLAFSQDNIKKEPASFIKLDFEP